MKYLDFVSNPELTRTYCRKLASPLVSMLNNEPEIGYVVLKNINLIIQKRPTIMEKELKVFFVNFNDPIYLKIEKIDIMIRLANNDNIYQILHELKEYTNEVDVEFARKSIKAIGSCAIKLEKAAEKCTTVLWECLKTGILHVVQETIIVIRDVFRKYPRKFDALLIDIFENVKALEDPDARGAIIWIIGEYVDIIENANVLLPNFIKNFKEEPTTVQMQILTSSVKLFLVRPGEGHEIIQGLLKMVTTESENPDIRDRGFIYWRLLSKYPEVAKKIVFAERPEISYDSYTLDSFLLDRLVENIGSLSSVFYKPPEAFVKKLRDIINQKDIDYDFEQGDPEELLANQEQADYGLGDLKIGNNLSSDIMEEKTPSNPTPNQPQTQPQTKATDNLLDLDDILGGTPVSENKPQPTPNLAQEQPAVSNPQPNAPSANIKIPMTPVFSENDESVEKKLKGLKISASVQREGVKMMLYLSITNNFQTSLSVSFRITKDMAIKLNKNAFRLIPVSIPITGVSVLPGTTQNIPIEIAASGEADNQPPSVPFKIQVALKTNMDIFAFFVPCSLSALMIPTEPITVQTYQELATKENVAKKQDAISSKMDNAGIKEKFRNNNLFYVGSRFNQAGIELMSFFGKTVNDMPLLLDVINDTGSGTLQINYIVPHPSLLPLFYQAIGFIVTLN